MIGKLKYMFKISICILSAPIAHADVATDLGNFWRGHGGVYNVNKPGSFISQSGGYHTLGGVNSRAPVRSVNLGNIQLPSARAGCSGIDVFSGGFSHINSTQMTATLKAIASNAVGYAFKLALETLSPKLMDVLESVREQADQINRLNINSCEQAQQLVGSIWAKSEESTKTICADIGNSKGIFSDYAASRHGCHGTARKSTLDQDPTRTYRNKNVAWTIIRKVAPFNSDQQMAELAMTLTGTVIPISQANAAEYIIYKPPMGVETIGDKEGLWLTLMSGGKAKIYKCDEPINCMTITTQEVTIQNTDAISHKVQGLIKNMQDQVRTGCSDTDASNETCFAADEHKILEQTEFPLLTLLNAYSVYGTAIGTSPEVYSDIIAIGMIKSYFDDIMSVVSRAAAVSNTNEKEIFEQWQKSFVSVRNTIQEKYTQKLAANKSGLDMTNRINFIDKMVQSDVAGQMRQNITFERNNR